MKLSTRFLSLAVAATATCAAPTIYMAGDSTMVATGNGAGTEGWGAFLNNYTSLAVVNNAVAGRSARSFTREGRFTAMAAKVKSGDYVIIEFGHNDGGGLTPTDNGRSDCTPVSGNYATTCSTTYNGVAETVQTYYTYTVNAAKLFQAKGANVIICSSTPNNPWETGTFIYSSSRFTTYARDAATKVSTTFVDHGTYTANLFKAAGATTVDTYFPFDHTHTSPAGANVVAHAFVLGLEAGTSTLKQYITKT